eukprot:5463877-Pleurochrysis_carterae.AAC.1
MVIACAARLRSSVLSRGARKMSRRVADGIYMSAESERTVNIRSRCHPHEKVRETVELQVTQPPVMQTANQPSCTKIPQQILLPSAAFGYQAHTPLRLIA